MLDTNGVLAAKQTSAGASLNAFNANYANHENFPQG